MRAASSIGALAWAAAVLVMAATSAAQPADGPTGPDPQGQPGDRSRPVVAVSVAGDEAAAEALERALTELLGRLNASLSLRRVEGLNQAPERPPEQAAAWVGIDVSHPDRAVVTVVDRAAGAATVWRVLERRTSRQILLDEAAHVVHAAVESLLSGQRANGGQAGTTAPPDGASAPPAVTGSPAVPAPASPAHAPRTAPLPPAPVAAPPPPERPLWGLDAAALLAGHGMADNAGLVFGAAGALSAGYRQGPWRFGGWLTAEYRVPFDVDDSETSPRAQAVALRTFPTMGLLQTPALSLDLGVGGGIDIFTVDYKRAPRSPPSSPACWCSTWPWSTTFS
ncbi:MAG: hypothetical protein JRI68_24400 [Deltaproteobacteria bacterium]|nr:hypothetical protein [Deltaproteobacteria bacterium]